MLSDDQPLTEIRIDPLDVLNPTTDGHATSYGNPYAFALQKSQSVDHEQLAFFGLIIEVIRRAMISTEPMPE
jgi:hypothetical protein